MQRRFIDAQGERRNNFDFLRFVLAGLVLVYHCYPLLYGPARPSRSIGAHWAGFAGGVAVDGFFVISGFLVAGSWTRAPRVGEFLKKRVLRIYPGFIAASVFCALVVGPLGAESVGAYFHGFHPVGFLVYALLLGGPVIPPTLLQVPFAGAVDGSFWTLRYEFECYLLVLALGLTLLPRARALVAVLFVVSAALNAAQQILAAQWVPERDYRLIGNPADWLLLLPCFLAGMTLYLYSDRIPYSGALAGVSGIAVLGLAAVNLHWATALVPIAGAYALLHTALNRSLPLQNWARHGDFSYGIYLYAFPVQQLWVRFLGGRLSILTLFLLSASCTLILAAGSWHLVEQPALRLKGLRGSGDAHPVIVAEPVAE